MGVINLLGVVFKIVLEVFFGVLLFFVGWLVMEGVMVFFVLSDGINVFGGKIVLLVLLE